MARAPSRTPVVGRRRQDPGQRMGQLGAIGLHPGALLEPVPRVAIAAQPHQRHRVGEPRLGRRAG